MTTATGEAGIEMAITLQSPYHEFIGHLSDLLVPVFVSTVPGRDGAEFQRPLGWQKSSHQGNPARLAAWQPGDAMCGVMGGNVVVIDVDVRNGGDIELARALLAHIGVTIYAEVKTPGLGVHFYVAGHPEIATVHAHDGRDGFTGYPGMEMLSYGAHAFLPGTQRPVYDGRGYTVVLDNLAALADGGDPDGAEALAGWAATHRAVAVEPFEPSPPWDGSKPDFRQSRYLAAVIDGLAAGLEKMGPSSGRNVAVYDAALKCGSFIAGAGMDEPGVIGRLTQAATTCGLVADDGAANVNASIRSGLRNGRQNPRAVPDEKPALTISAPILSPEDEMVFASTIETPKTAAKVKAMAGPAEDGAALLDAVQAFLARFIVYPSIHELVAHALWIVHTWFMDVWESTPRMAFLSPEPGSGKSRALEVTEPLVPRPVHAVNTTPAYLFRKVSDDAGPPTILYDEIDTVFGPKAKDNEDIRGMLNAGHRRGAMAGRCVVRGKIIETEELPAYCAVALAGLNDLPDTLMSRSIVIRMRRRAAHERIEPWRMRRQGAEGAELGFRLQAWAAGMEDQLGTTWPVMPDGIEDRNADVWEALLAVADLAGGDWPDRARVAAVTLVTHSQSGTPSIGLLLLSDIREMFRKSGQERLSTEALLLKLVDLEESPWGDLHGKALDARGLAFRLSPYSTNENPVRPKPLRIGEIVQRGYEATDFADAWNRYLPPPEEGVTAVTETPDLLFDLSPNRRTQQ